MRVIEVAVNGTLRWRAGIENASIIAPALSAWVADDSPASLMVSGMCDLDQARAAHVHWCERWSLANGDLVTFKFTESDDVTPPEAIVPTDSPAYLQDQRGFAESLKDFVPDRAPAVRKRPGLAFECQLNGKPAAIASLVGSEEHILSSLLWIKQRPDRCDVSVRTFGDKSKPEESPATEWLRTSLALNDAFSVRIAA
jgi:hypothetical protein